MRKIIFHLNCLEFGGAERVVSTLANHMAAEGYEVILATEWQGEHEYTLDERVRRVHVGLKGIDENKSRVIKAWKRIQYLRELIRKEHPDVTVAFARKALYRALTATMFTKEKVIIAVRTDPRETYSDFVNRFLTFVLFPHASGAVFQTVGQRDFFPNYLQKKSAVIINPINEKYVRTSISKSREKVVVHSGRIVDFKNQDMLIRAFIEVHRKHPDYILKLYGSDSKDGTWEQLTTTIREFHADDYVKLMGNSEHLEKDLINGAVYAFSSDYEGFPNALLEALAMGLPVVATDCPCGGPRTVIKNEKNGLLVPVGNQKALEEGINRLIEDRDLAERLAGEAKKITETLNTTEIANQWCQYIDSIVK